MPFVLDTKLAESSFFIEDWPLCHVTLKNDKTWPWLYLVPRREDIREIYELNIADQSQLMREIARAGHVLHALHAPAKINTAALGNVVPQLHVHIFARFEKDIAWPRPVWAVQHAEIPYTESEKNIEIERLRAIFRAMPEGE